MTVDRFVSPNEKNAKKNPGLWKRTFFGVGWRRGEALFQSAGYVVSTRSHKSNRQHGNNMTSSQDNFYALQLLGFQGQRVTKSTATKSKLNTLRHFSEDLRTVQDEGHQHE